MIAGVDGAALRAFFKPSLGAALLSLLPDRRLSSCTTVVGRDKDRATRATVAWGQKPVYVIVIGSIKIRTRGL